MDFVFSQIEMLSVAFIIIEKKAGGSIFHDVLLVFLETLDVKTLRVILFFQVDHALQSFEYLFESFQISNEKEVRGPEVKLVANILAVLAFF